MVYTRLPSYAIVSHKFLCVWYLRVHAGAYVYMLILCVRVMLSQTRKILFSIIQHHVNAHKLHSRLTYQNTIPK